MARLYSNENFPQPVVEALRSLGHDVLTSLEAGKANQRIEDPEVLEYAASLGRALLTLNRGDFRRLHEAGVDHEGIIGCTADDDFAGQARRITEALLGQPTLKRQYVRVVKGP